MPAGDSALYSTNLITPSSPMKPSRREDGEAAAKPGSASARASSRGSRSSERRIDRLGGGVHRRVLPLADEIRSKRDAKGPLAEHQAALVLTLGQHRRALLREHDVL